MDNPEAKLLDYNRYRISTGLQNRDVECQDVLKIEMAQGTPHLSVRFNRAWNARASLPPSSRVGKALPNRVIYERYLEPAYIDFAGRQRFRVRCRVALRGNAIFSMDYEQERNRRAFYPGQIIIKEPLIIDIASVSTAEAAIRLLCQPFGEIDTISPSVHSNGEMEGSDVKFADRNASTRAQQQLSLLIGVICNRAPPPSHTPAPNLLIPETPKLATRGATSRQGYFSAGVHNLAFGEPKLVKLPRLETSREVSGATAEEWPALPSSRGLGTRPIPSSALEDQPVSAAGVSNIKITPQPQLESTLLSPVEEEPADIASDAMVQIPTVAHPGKKEAAENSSSDGKQPFKPEEPPVLPGHGAESLTMPSDLYPITSALGLSHVPILTASRLDIPPDPKSKHAAAYTKTSTSHKSIPIVSLGSSEQRLNALDPGPGAQRMTLELRDVSSGETEATLRERFKPYGRVVSALLQLS